MIVGAPEVGALGGRTAVTIGWHFAALHVVASLSAGHDAPPNVASFVTDRVRAALPVSHGLEQSCHAVQLDTEQSIGQSALEQSIDCDSRAHSAIAPPDDAGVTIVRARCRLPVLHEAEHAPQLAHAEVVQSTGHA